MSKSTATFASRNPARRAAIAAAVALTLGAVYPAAAQTAIWDGSEPNDNWFTPANWDIGIVPNGATFNVTVGAPAPTVLNGDVSINSLNVTAAGALTISSGFNLDLTAGGSLTQQRRH